MTYICCRLKFDRSISFVNLRYSSLSIIKLIINVSFSAPYIRRVIREIRTYTGQPDERKNRSYASSVPSLKINFTSEAGIPQLQSLERISVNHRTVLYLAKLQEHGVLDQGKWETRRKGMELWQNFLTINPRVQLCFCMLPNLFRTTVWKSLRKSVRFALYKCTVSKLFSLSYLLWYLHIN